MRFLLTFVLFLFASAVMGDIVVEKKVSRPTHARKVTKDKEITKCHKEVTKSKEVKKEVTKCHKHKKHHGLKCHKHKKHHGLKCHKHKKHHGLKCHKHRHHRHHKHRQCR